MHTISKEQFQGCNRNNTKTTQYTYIYKTRLPYMSYSQFSSNLENIICIWQSLQQRIKKNRQSFQKVQTTTTITELITIQSAGDFPPTKHEDKPVLRIDLLHAFSNLDRNVRFVYYRISSAKIKRIFPFSIASYVANPATHFNESNCRKVKKIALGSYENSNSASDL